MDVLNLIEEFGEIEEKITDLEFVSPIFFNEIVATRISGLLHTFTVPRKKPGWYKIKPNDSISARFIGEADFLDIDKYLKKLGKIRITLVMKKKNVYLGIPDKSNRFDLPVQELIPVLLYDDAVLDFDRVIARYDGTNVWFETVDINNDPSKSDYLRESIEKGRSPSSIRYDGLTFEEKLAYTLRFGLDKDLKKERRRCSLKDDVEHAGGVFVRHVERSDHFSVTYRVDGEEYTSHISKDERRMVISAGICLEGNDTLFDLKSLITVVREAQDRHLIHRFSIRE